MTDTSATMPRDQCGPGVWLGAACFIPSLPNLLTLQPSLFIQEKAELNLARASSFFRSEERRFFSGGQHELSEGRTAN